MKKYINNKIARLGLLVVVVASGFALAAVTGGGIVLVDLLESNMRFASGQMEHGHQSVERRLEVAAGQNPHTIVLTCADSRVAPEIVFDQGLGDLFVIRVAGNVSDPYILASIEYAVEHLKCTRLIVMGHERCGAVHAAVEEVLHPRPPASPHLAKLVKKIKPAVLKAKKSNPTDLLDASVRENVNRAVREITKRSPILREKIEHGELVVEAAYYDLDTGLVSEP